MYRAGRAWPKMQSWPETNVKFSAFRGILQEEETHAPRNSIFQSGSWQNVKLQSTVPHRKWVVGERERVGGEKSPNAELGEVGNQRDYDIKCKQRQEAYQSYFPDLHVFACGWRAAAVIIDALVCLLGASRLWKSLLRSVTPHPVQRHSGPSCH